jgi:hypothetical protein
MNLLSLISPRLKTFCQIKVLQCLLTLTPQTKQPLLLLARSPRNLYYTSITVACHGFISGVYLKKKPNNDIFL